MTRIWWASKQHLVSGESGLMGAFLITNFGDSRIFVRYPWPKRRILWLFLVFLIQNQPLSAVWSKIIT
jgi:hypothetical protein